MLSLLFFFISFYSSHHVTSKTCDSAYSCAKEAVSSSTSEIECRGYHSCSEATSIVQNATENIQCDGSYSCYKSNKIISYDSGDRNIKCNGLYSCAFVNNIYEVTGEIDCNAELSCFGSTMTCSW